MKIWIVRLLCVACLLITWYLFGLYYLHEANESHGSSFVFQQDLEIRSKYLYFLKNHKNIVSEALFKSILKELEINPITSSMTHTTTAELYLCKPFVAFKPSPFLRNPIYIHWELESGCPIGEIWAMYFANQYDPRNLMFTITALRRGKYDNYFGFPFKVTMFTCDYYASMDYDTGIKPTNERQLDKFIVYFSFPELSRFRWYNKKNTYFSGHYLHELIRNSIIFPGNDCTVFDKIRTGEYRYDKWDFLYFSAVTMTTLGYGDILPNSTKVRKMVMAETLLGMIFMGALISSLFTKSKNDGKCV